MGVWRKSPHQVQGQSPSPGGAGAWLPKAERLLHDHDLRGGQFVLKSVLYKRKKIVGRLTPTAPLDPPVLSFSVGIS